MSRITRAFDISVFKGQLSIDGQAVLDQLELVSNPTHLARIFQRLANGLERWIQSFPALESHLHAARALITPPSERFESNWVVDVSRVSSTTNPLAGHLQRHPINAAFVADLGLVEEELYGVCLGFGYALKVGGAPVREVRDYFAALRQVVELGSVADHDYLLIFAKALAEWDAGGGEAFAMPSAPPQLAGNFRTKVSDLLAAARSTLRVQAEEPGVQAQVFRGPPSNPAIEAHLDSAISIHVARERYVQAVDARTLLPTSIKRLHDQAKVALLNPVTGTPILVKACMGLGIKPSSLLEQPLPVDVGFGRTAAGKWVLYRVLRPHFAGSPFSPGTEVHGRYRPSGATLRLEVELGEGFEWPLTKAQVTPPNVGNVGGALEPRIARVLAATLLDATGDLPLVTALLGGEVSNTNIFYTSYNPHVIARGIEKEFPFVRVQVQGDEDAQMGSAGVPRIEQLLPLLAAARRKILAIDRTTHPVAFHNHYTAYVVMLLTWASGARQVSDPFHLRSLFMPSRQLVILHDKVSLRSHQGRPAAMPPMGFRQLELYVDYLRTLPGRLCTRGSFYARDIECLISSEPARIGLFFLIENNRAVAMTPAGTATYCEISRYFHPSAHRHALSTMARELGVIPDYVTYDLGHWREQEAPFAADSVVRLSDWIPKLAAVKQIILERAGFEVLDIVPRGRGRPVKAVLHPVAASLVEPADRLLGPDARSAQRAARRARDEAVMLRSLAQAQQELGVKNSVFTKQVVERAEGLIEERARSVPEFLGRRLALLRGHLLKLRNSHAGVHVPGAVYAPIDGPPLLRDMTGQSIALIDTVREALGPWIDGHHDALSHDVHKRSAVALLSAIIWGGLIQRALWKPFVHALHQGYFCVNGHSWLSLAPAKEERRPRRYIGDPLTQVLVGYAARHQPDRSPSADAVIRMAQKILTEIQSSKKITTPWLLDDLHKAAHDVCAVETSGEVMAYLSGEVPTTSLGDRQLIRLLQAGVFDSENELQLQQSSFRTRAPAQDPSHQIDQKKISDQFESFVDITGDLKRESRSVAQRFRNAVERIESLQADISRRGSWPILQMLVRYARHLLVHGGEHKSRLSAATIYDYARVLAPALMAVLGETHPGELDSEELTSAYEAVLDLKPSGRSARIRRARRLRLFHQYLGGAVAAVQWREIEPGLLDVDHDADANILGLSDRDRMHALLPRVARSHGVDAQELKRLLYLMSTGQRIGEALHRRSEDVLTHRQAQAVICRGTSKWHMKSKASHRLAIGLPHGLPDHALQIESVPGQWLLGIDPAEQHRKQAMVAALSQLMRLATGDSELHPHHFRHTAVTLSQLLVGANTPTGRALLELRDRESFESSACELRRRLSGLDVPTRRLGDGLRLAVGHAPHSRVTSAVYGNATEFVAAAQLAERSIAINQKTLVFLLGKAGSALSMAASRHRINLASMSDLNEVVARMANDDRLPAGFMVSVNQRSDARTAVEPPGAPKMKLQEIPGYLEALVVNGDVCGVADQLGIAVDTVRYAAVEITASLRRSSRDVLGMRALQRDVSDRNALAKYRRMLCCKNPHPLVMAMKQAFESECDQVREASIHWAVLVSAHHQSGREALLLTPADAARLDQHSSVMGLDLNLTRMRDSRRARDCAATQFHYRFDALKPRQFFFVVDTAFLIRLRKLLCINDKFKSAQ